MGERGVTMEKEFDTLPIRTLVLHLGIPAMAAQFFNILYSIVDRIFIGHMINGETAIAGIGVCAPILNSITAVSSLVGIGGASILSISMGRHNRKTAQKTINTALFLLICFSALLTINLWIFAKPILYFLGCSDTLYPYAGSYFRTYIVGTAAVLLGLGMNQFILAQGLAKQGMISVVLGAVINTILDPIFIFALDMGIKGAAIATVIGQIAAMFYVLLMLCGEQVEIRLAAPKPDIHNACRILQIGFLPCLIVLLENILMIVLNVTLRKYGGDTLGKDYITCATVVQSFMVFIYSPGYGFTQGCGTLYGYNYGAGNYKRVMQTFQWVLIVCAVYMGAIALLSQTIPTLFVRIFLKDEHLISLASKCIRRYAAGLLGVAVQYAFVDGLTAMGKIKYAMPLSLFRRFLYIGAVLIIPGFLPLDTVFWAETICDIGGAMVTLAMFFVIIKPALKAEMGR